MFSQTELGIDLGTANILVYSKQKGIVINEPSVIAMDIHTKECVAFGSDASYMIGKTPEHIEVIQPLKGGVIADYEMTVELLKSILKKAGKSIGTTVRKPTVVVCTPSGSTSVERRAIHDAVASYGAKNIHLIEEPVAAAIGSDLPVDEPLANVIVDIGGGTTEIGIISFGGIVSGNAIRVGGDSFDEEIIQYIRKTYNVLVGNSTAELIKFEIGHADPDHEPMTMSVRGRDLVTGLPTTLELASTEIHTALKDSLQQILEAIRQTLESCPPELSGDIVDHGIVLTGGSSLLNGLEKWLTKTVFVPVHQSQNPLESVAIGTGKSLAMMSKLEKLTK